MRLITPTDARLRILEVYDLSHHTLYTRNVIYGWKINEISNKLGISLVRVLAHIHANKLYKKFYSPVSIERRIIIQ